MHGGGGGGEVTFVVFDDGGEVTFVVFDADGEVTFVVMFGGGDGDTAVHHATSPFAGTVSSHLQSSCSTTAFRGNPQLHIDDR